jgi:hypothetical protein
LAHPTILRLSFPTTVSASIRVLFRPVSLLIASQIRITRFLAGTVPTKARPVFGE